MTEFVEQNNIYLLYACNIWKEHSSMRLIMTSVDFTKIKKQIIKELENKDMEIDNNIDVKYEKILCEPIKTINNSLMYGYVLEIIDGEEQ